MLHLHVWWSSLWRNLKEVLAISLPEPHHTVWDGEKWWSRDAGLDMDCANCSSVNYWKILGFGELELLVSIRCGFKWIAFSTQQIGIGLWLLGNFCGVILVWIFCGSFFVLDKFSLNTQNVDTSFRSYSCLEQNQKLWSKRNCHWLDAFRGVSGSAANPFILTYFNLQVRLF